MSGYPTAKEYAAAVQHPSSFPREQFRRAEFVRHPVFGIPAPVTGTSAAVFKVRLDGGEHALRFYTTERAGDRDRYRDLRAHFLAHDLASSMAMFEWVDDGIRIGGRTLPAVRMEWVRGQRLNEHVEALVAQGDMHGLARLAQRWRELVARLQRVGFAHGDLQHGNVLVDESGTLRLVDFDCSWIERFTGQRPPDETGHRNYQPLDPASRPWGPWMDTFSGLVVYTSLQALSRNPNPWVALNTGENMLFSQSDFRAPFDTQAWRHLSGIGDGEIDELAAHLRSCCARGWSATGGLDELIAREIPWWERIRAPEPPPTGPHPTTGADGGRRPPPRDRVLGGDGAEWWQRVPRPESGSARPPRAGEQPPPPPPPPPPRSMARAGWSAAAIGLVVALVAAVLIAAAGGPGALGLVLGVVVGIVCFVALASRRR